MTNLRESIVENVFLIGIFVWIIVLITISKLIDLHKYPYVIIALLYPIINLYYNHYSNNDDNNQNEDESNEKLRDERSTFHIDRIHTNSLYIATGVFAVNGISNKILGKDYVRIVPYYLLTILFGVGFNLLIYFSKNKEQDILITNIKSIILAYGTAFMCIGIIYSLSILNLRK